MENRDLRNRLDDEVVCLTAKNVSVPYIIKGSKKDEMKKVDSSFSICVKFIMFIMCYVGQVD